MLGGEVGAAEVGGAEVIRSQPPSDAGEQSVSLFSGRSVWSCLVGPGIVRQRTEKVAQAEYRVFTMALVINFFFEVNIPLFNLLSCY